MDAKQKEEISHLRVQGMTYEQVAKQLQLSVNTIKSYCQRNQLGGRKKLFPRNISASSVERKLNKLCIVSRRNSVLINAV